MLTPELQARVSTLEQALSVLGTGGPYLKAILEGLPKHPEDERFLVGAARCALAYSSRAFYTSRAAKDPDYWPKFYASQPLSYIEQEPCSDAEDRGGPQDSITPG